MKTWMKMILKGPRLLSLAPLTAGDTWKDNIQLSLGDEIQEKPSDVLHVIKIFKRIKIKGKKASKDHSHF
jgi:hypothetical protein